MHDVPLLINITLALVIAFAGGWLARKMGLPTILGYLITGVIIGPFTPGFVGDLDTIQQLAELGVIFLMFGVGLHFSFQDLWRVRDVAIPGALIQTTLSSLLGFGLSQLWGWSAPAGIVLGLSISVASTVVLLRNLMDHSLLNTVHGQAAVGWLVMEDILSVWILVLMPIFATSSHGINWQILGVTLAKAAAFMGLMFFAGARLIPWLLERIAHTRSRELFILATLAITLGTAMGAAEFFGVSLALGAFMAGAIISQSQLSHQVSADVFAFREAFSVLFFVSIGMLVNPLFLWQNLGYVAALTALVILGKALIVLLMGLFFPRPARTFLIIAVGLSQIGEFSFILGQAGLSLHMLNANQYSLILAAALLSITVNPFLYKLLPFLETTLQHFPHFWKHLEANRPLPEVQPQQLEQHVVVVGYGQTGRQLVAVLRSLSIPLLVVETDPEVIELLNQQGIPTLYGDAGNSEILQHAHLEHARALISTTPDEATATLVVATAHDIHPDLVIIARASTPQGAHALAERGAQHIVQPELEGSLEIIHSTLLSLGFPLREVHQYLEAIRRDHSSPHTLSGTEYRSLRQLLRKFEEIEISWMEVNATSPLVGKSLRETNLRSQTGASVIAIIRGEELMPNPKSITIFKPGDYIGLIGTPSQLAQVQELLA